MQRKHGQIITNFPPDTTFDVAASTETDTRRFQIAKLLIIPLEEQPTRNGLNPSDRRGIPFSAIND